VSAGVGAPREPPTPRLPGDPDYGHTLRLSRLGGQASATLEGSFERKERDRLHVEGSHDGKMFSLDLTRDFPR
jgi:hypothetical protein